MAPSLVAKRMTLRVVISFGTPPLPASLRSNTVACCIEIAARICANRSPGATRTSSTARPGRTSLSIRCWIGGDPEPPAISLTGAIEIAAPEDAIASTSVAASREPWTTVTSSPRSPRSDAAEMVSFALACTWMRRPSSRAAAHAAAAPSEATPWAIAPNAIVVDGPARSRRRTARPVVAGAASTNTVRTPASACAWSAASARSSGPAEDQSTTVVMPASAAPSSPIRVEA